MAWIPLLFSHLPFAEMLKYSVPPWTGSFNAHQSLHCFVSQFFHSLIDDRLRRRPTLSWAIVWLSHPLASPAIEFFSSVILIVQRECFRCCRILRDRLSLKYLTAFHGEIREFAAAKQNCPRWTDGSTQRFRYFRRFMCRMPRIQWTIQSIPIWPWQ